MSNLPARLRTAIKRIPGAQTVYFKVAGLQLPRDTEDAFRHVVAEKMWGEHDSLSGGGSDLEQTRVVRERLPMLWSEFSIRTMLDIPCGDFFWMQHVPMGELQYVGADILPELVERNSERFTRANVEFRTLDLLEDPLPKVDMIFCRDCLMHLPFRQVVKALRNACDSGSEYLLTTTFADRRRNHDISAGQFRPLNLQARPISLPPPVVLINENCTEEGGAYRDKSLGLWRLADIRDSLPR